MKHGERLLIFILVWLPILACSQIANGFIPKNSSEEIIEPEVTLIIHDFRISPVDSMPLVLVPAGDFIMGSYEDPSNFGFPNVIFLDEFWIDQTEVTNSQYQKCVSAGVCDPPRENSNYKRDHYYTDHQYQNFPVTQVTWFQADDYCRWAGRRLPTETEWEKAARGLDGQRYPWGNEPPEYDLLNFKGKAGKKNPNEGPVAVGSYLKGASPYGALDMAGNVAEWVADWYGQFYFKTPQAANPAGPLMGDERVYRGGDWDTYDVVIQSSYRLGLNPTSFNAHIGFRCAVEDSP